MSSNLLLHQAVIRGDIGAVKQQLSGVKEVNQRDKENRTPLHIAIEANRPDLVELLLEHGANPNLGYHRTIRADFNEIAEFKPLYLAITTVAPSSPAAVLSGSEHIASLLITYGARLDDKHYHLGLDWDAKDNTLLHVAVQCRRPDLVALLLKAGADVNALNAKRRPPLYGAFIIRGMDRPEITLRNFLALHEGKPMPPAMEKIDKEEEEAYRALAIVLSQLVYAGAKSHFQIHFTGSIKDKMFHLFNGRAEIAQHVQQINRLFYKAIAQGNQEQVAYFLETYPGVINAKNEKQQTPISFALEKKHDAMTSLLLRQLEVKLHGEITALTVYGEQLIRRGRGGEKIIQFAKTLEQEAQTFFRNAPCSEEKCQAFQSQFLNTLAQAKELPAQAASLTTILKRMAFIVISIVVPVIPLGLYIHGKVTNNPNTFYFMHNKNKAKEKAELMEDIVNSALPKNNPG